MAVLTPLLPAPSLSCIAAPRSGVRTKRISLLWSKTLPMTPRGAQHTIRNDAGAITKIPKCCTNEIPEFYRGLIRATDASDTLGSKWLGVAQFPAWVPPDCWRLGEPPTPQHFFTLLGFIFCQQCQCRSRRVAGGGCASPAIKPASRPVWAALDLASCEFPMACLLFAKICWEKGEKSRVLPLMLCF